MQKNGANDPSLQDPDTTTERLAYLGQIAAGIAHEVRNPLTSVKGFLQLLQEEQPHPYLDVAAAELDRAISTLKNLLQVSRPETSEDYEPIALWSELENVLYLFQGQMYHVQVVKDFRDKQFQVIGQRNQLKRAFFNLLKNAFEAIGDDGMIACQHYLEDDCIIIQITDNGIGMSAEDVARLGTPFFSNKGEGTGLGIAQVYATMHHHGGSLEVTSELNTGTTFTLKFPLFDEPVQRRYTMNLTYQNEETFSAFVAANRKEFQNGLQHSAVNAFNYIEELEQKPDELFHVIDQVVELLIAGNRQELVLLGKKLGRSAARSDYPLPLIMELVESLRRNIWELIRVYHTHVNIDAASVFELERQYNNGLDLYLAHYFTDYMDVKDKIVQSQRDAIDDLSVPVIPIMNAKAILPIVGTIDTYRAQKIQEKTLSQIAELRLEHLIIDLSGVAFLDTAVVAHLFRIVDGIALLGCNATVTGIRPEIAHTIVNLGIELDAKVNVRGTLQQALEEDRTYPAAEKIK